MTYIAIAIAAFLVGFLLRRDERKPKPLTAVPLWSRLVGIGMNRTMGK